MTPNQIWTPILLINEVFSIQVQLELELDLELNSTDHGLGVELGLGLGRVDLSWVVRP